MVTEDFCSVETAKLLIEKGYNGPSVFYSDEEAADWRSSNLIEIPNPDYDPNLPFDSEVMLVALPHITLSMAMKWLRETFEIHCQIDCPIAAFNWRYGIRDLDKDEWVTLRDMGDYDTYEEACEAAIKYCLENLI